MGLAGPGKFWLMSGTADISPFILSGKFVVEKGRFLILRPPPAYLQSTFSKTNVLWFSIDSSAAKAIVGNGIIFCKGGLPGVGGSYDKFTQEWKKLGEIDALDFINSKQPSNCTHASSFFESLPHHIVTFSYDAIVGLGLSACASQRSTSNDVMFSGKEHRDTFFRNTFRGASGDFLLREDFPTRTADSSYFVMVNMAEREVNSAHVSFTGSPLSFFWETNDRQWQQRGANAFKYSGGSLTPPPELQEFSEKEGGTPSWVPLLCSFTVAFIATSASIIYVKKRHNQVDANGVWISKNFVLTSHQRS